MRLNAALDSDRFADKKATIRQMFDRICARYDLNNRLLSFGLDTYWRWRAANLLGLRSGDSVVDICCGTGDLAAVLARRVDPGRVVGVDFSTEMLNRAGQKYPNIEYVVADATDVPLEGGFSAATIAFGPRNIPDLDALWKEMARLVKPGGKVLSLELTRPCGILGVLHGLYLRYVVPWLGGWVSGDREAYDYLSRTIAAFISSERLAESMAEAGLQRVETHPLCGGIVTVHIGHLPTL